MRKSKYIILKSHKKLKTKKCQKNNSKKTINKLYFLIIFEIFVLIFLFSFIVKLKKKNKKEFKGKELLTNETIVIEKGREFYGNNTLNKEKFFYRYLCPKEVIGKTKIIYGQYGDGGYVLLDDLKDIKIAYSFGISSIVSFEKALADKGIDVYMYDHTIFALPFDNPKYHWKKIGLAGETKKAYNLKTIKELLIENGHTQEKNMILKIDIENNEWDVLNEISDYILNQFKYIIIEFHFWNIDNNFELYIKCLKNIMKYHQIFHIHCCNCKEQLKIGDNPICNTIEVSYIKKEGNEFKKDESTYPIKGFDYKICPEKPSMDLEPNILKYCDNS